MRKGKRLVAPLLGAVCVIGFAGLANATPFAGNGATGFGGTLGNGSLSFTDDGAGNLTATLNTSGSFTSNDVVVYIDSKTGGFADTSSFSDNGDLGRTAVSAYNSGNGGTPSRELITFPTGFTADYAIEFENTVFNGLFSLVAGGNNSLNYVTGASPGGTDSLTFPLADIGLTQGQSFKFVGDLISTSAYGSNESIGASTTVPDNGGDAPNAGFNGTVTFSSPDTYVSTAVPEPVSLAVICVGGLFLTSRRRTRIA